MDRKTNNLKDEEEQEETEEWRRVERKTVTKVDLQLTSKHLKFEMSHSHSHTHKRTNTSSFSRTLSYTRSNSQFTMGLTTMRF